MHLPGLKAELDSLMAEFQSAHESLNLALRRKYVTYLDGEPDATSVNKRGRSVPEKPKPSRRFSRLRTLIHVCNNYFSGKVANFKLRFSKVNDLRHRLKRWFHLKKL